MTRRATFKFRLYTAEGTRNSAQALPNLTAICKEYLEGRFEIDIVDVLNHPERALADGIRMTPALLKLSPAPVCRIVGTLSDLKAVLAALGLDAEAA
jgi:circadian clock protein KaiB